VQCQGHRHRPVLKLVLNPPVASKFHGFDSGPKSTLPLLLKLSDGLTAGNRTTGSERSVSSTTGKRWLTCALNCDRSIDLIPIGGILSCGASSTHSIDFQLVPWPVRFSFAFHRPGGEIASGVVSPIGAGAVQVDLRMTG
jgi:hypothetical protein